MCIHAGNVLAVSSAKLPASMFGSMEVKNVMGRFKLILLFCHLSNKILLSYKKRFISRKCTFSLTIAPYNLLFRD